MCKRRLETLKPKFVDWGQGSRVKNIENNKEVGQLVMRLLSSAIEGGSQCYMGFSFTQGTRNVEMFNFLLVVVSFNPVNHRAEVRPSGELEPTLLCGWLAMENRGIDSQVG